MPDSSPRDETESLGIEGIPPDLKSRFKARCAEEKRTMREVFLQFMAAFSATDPIGK